MDTQNPELAWTPVRLGLKYYRCEWRVDQSNTILLSSATHRGREAEDRQRSKLYLRGLTLKPNRDLLDRVLDDPGNAQYWRRQALMKRVVTAIFGWLIFAGVIAAIEVRYPLWHRLGPEFGDAAMFALMAVTGYVGMKLKALTMRALRIAL